MAQKEKVLEYLQQGKTITPVKAIAEFAVYRLAAIIHRLRDEGHNITTVMKRSHNGKPYAEYRLNINKG